MALHFGLFSINAYAAVEPRTAARLAQAAEAAGFESLWGGEHVVLPDPQAPPSPMGPREPILDPAIALTFAAAHTSRVRLGTGIIILPQRNPLVLAKELASLDVLSAGRLIVGVGVGYLEPEFRALGAPFKDRAPSPTSTSRPCAPSGVRTSRPTRGASSRSPTCRRIRSPYSGRHPPIVIGGRTAPAFRRAVSQ